MKICAETKLLTHVLQGIMCGNHHYWYLLILNWVIKSKLYSQPWHISHKTGPHKQKYSKTNTHSCTHSASSCAISLSSSSLLLSSSATSSEGLTLARSVTWSCEVQNRQLWYWNAHCASLCLWQRLLTYRWLEAGVYFRKLWEWSSWKKGKESIIEENVDRKKVSLRSLDICSLLISLIITTPNCQMCVFNRLLYTVIMSEVANKDFYICQRSFL